MPDLELNYYQSNLRIKNIFNINQNKMGSLIQNTIFGKSNYKINTYIGGIGNAINTPALLAAKLGISASRIKMFRILDNNIECAIIGGTYSLTNSSWLSSNMTYFIDEKNLAVTDEGRVFRSATLLQKIKLNGLLNTGDESFTNTNLVEISLPNVTNLKGRYGSFRINPKLKRIILPEASYSEWSFSGMDGCTSLETVYIPKLAILRSGSSAALNNFVFASNKTGFKIYASPLAQTSYLGGVDKDIAWAITNRSAIVRYVTDFTKPNAVIDLSVIPINSTSMKFQFTTPSSQNGIDFYEVYVNGVYKQELKASGDIISDFVENTSYAISLIAVDIFYNRSDLSNVINLSTNNAA